MPFGYCFHSCIRIIQEKCYLFFFLQEQQWNRKTIQSAIPEQVSIQNSLFLYYSEQHSRNREGIVHFGIAHMFLDGKHNYGLYWSTLRIIFHVHQLNCEQNVKKKNFPQNAQKEREKYTSFHVHQIKLSKVEHNIC